MRLLYFIVRVSVHQQRFPGGVNSVTPTRIKWMLFVFPALIIGGFETLRHTLLENILPMELGNWVTATIDAIAIAFISRALFAQFQKNQDDLLHERETRAVLEERERLVRALHDEIAQTVFYAGAQLSSIEQDTNVVSNPQLLDRIRDLHTVLRELNDSIRQAIYHLKRAPQSAFDFSQDVETFMSETFADTGIRFLLDIDAETLKHISAEHRTQLFMIIREAATNVFRHSGASTLRVSLHSSGREGTWVLEIMDNGHGFVPSRLKDNRFGIETMKMRARTLGAEFHVESSARGTAVTVERDRHATVSQPLGL